MNINEIDQTAQMQLFLAYGVCNNAVQATVGAIEPFVKDCNPANIARLRAAFSAVIVALDNLDAITRAGGVVTDFKAAVKAFNETPKPQLHVVPTANDSTNKPN